MALAQRVHRTSIDNIGEYHRLLLQRRDEILGRNSDTRSHIDEQLEASAGPGDEADLSVVDTSADYFLRLADNQRRELVEIDAAIDRIAKGAYGYCENCGNEISAGRLRNLPTARLCIDCKSANEARERVSRINPTPKL